MKKVFFLLATVIVFTSCDREVFDREFEVEGLQPIYAPANTWNQITAEDPQPIQQLGKIYYKDNFMYVVERLKGIHVIDNTDPTTPTPVKFIKVAGAKDIAMKNNYLYTDNATDMVVLDVSNLEDIKVVNRIDGIYDESQQAYPEFAEEGTFFECVDASRGVVVGWQSVMLSSPECRR